MQIQDAIQRTHLFLPSLKLVRTILKFDQPMDGISAPSISLFPLSRDRNVKFHGNIRLSNELKREEARYCSISLNGNC